MALAISCLLLPISALLSLPQRNGPSELIPVANPGVLEIAWRMGNAPGVGKQLIDQVKNLRISELRGVGMKIKVPTQTGNGTASLPELCHSDSVKSAI